MNDLGKLHQLVARWQEDKRRSHSTLIALDHIYSFEPRMNSTKEDDALVILKEFLAYVQLLKPMSAKQPGLITTAVKRLFAVRSNASFKFDLLSGTLLHTWAKEHEPSTRRIRSATSNLTESHLESIIIAATRARLVRRIRTFNVECLDSESFSPLVEPSTDARQADERRDRTLRLYCLHLRILGLVWLRYNLYYPCHSLTKQMPEFDLDLIR
jgi:hypothetical protein